jgi:hypothetical protein
MGGGYPTTVPDLQDSEYPSLKDMEAIMKKLRAAAPPPLKMVDSRDNLMGFMYNGQIMCNKQMFTMLADVFEKTVEPAKTFWIVQISEMAQEDLATMYAQMMADLFHLDDWLGRETKIILDGSEKWKTTLS